MQIRKLFLFIFIIFLAFSCQQKNDVTPDIFAGATIMSMAEYEDLVKSGKIVDNISQIKLWRILGKNR